MATMLRNYRAMSSLVSRAMTAGGRSDVCGRILMPTLAPQITRISSIRLSSSSSSGSSPTTPGTGDVMIDLPADQYEPQIPKYFDIVKRRPDEDKEIKRSRLMYQSRKRGMLENGLLLSSFAKKYLHTFNEEQLDMYDKLINSPSNDWEIYYWATGVKPTPSEYESPIMDLFKNFVKNEDREQRLHQPPLY